MLLRMLAHRFGALAGEVLARVQVASPMTSAAGPSGASTSRRSRPSSRRSPTPRARVPSVLAAPNHAGPARPPNATRLLACPPPR